MSDNRLFNQELKVTIIRTTLIAIMLLCCAPLIASTSALTYLQEVSNQTAGADTIGFLGAAIKEAKFIQQHSSLAVQQTENLSLIKTHSRYIAAALEGRGMSAEPNIGLIKASRGIIRQVKLAAAATDAGPAVKVHSMHIATSATNTVALAVTMLKISRQIGATTSLATAASLASQLQDFADILLLGTDSNGDGKITWIKYEGGLMHCQKHLQLLRAQANF